MIFLSLFSGIEGFYEGFNQAGHTFRKHYYSEIDKHGIAVTKYRYPDAENIGSVKFVRYIVRTIRKELREGERLILTFGSPCQDFSLAGNRQGLEGSKSSLIKYALFLIRWLRPDVYIWENVKGAYSTNDGSDYWAIIQAFANIDGYGLEQQLLNTSWFLPQNRERIYLIGHLTGRSEPGVFPIAENDRLANETRQETRGAGVQPNRIGKCLNSSMLKGNLEQDYVRTITAGGHSGGLHSDMTLLKKVEAVNPLDSQDNRLYDPQGLAPTLGSSQGSNQPKIIVPSATVQGFEVATEGDSINFENLTSNTRKGRVGKGVAQTLNTGCNQGVVIGAIRERNPDNPSDRTAGANLEQRLEINENGTSNTLTSVEKDNVVVNNDSIRRLTEIECERLQGFPDDWTRWGVYEKQVWINKKEGTFKLVEGVQEVSRTQRYKMLGNAVSVPVVKAIAERIKFI
jgi:DNA (cytosine-5)-methyltransferase 1